MKTCTSLDCPERKSVCCGVTARYVDEILICSECGKPFIPNPCTAQVGSVREEKCNYCDFIGEVTTEEGLCSRCWARPYRKNFEVNNMEKIPDRIIADGDVVESIKNNMPTQNQSDRMIETKMEENQKRRNDSKDIIGKRTDGTFHFADYCTDEWLRKALIQIQAATREEVLDEVMAVLPEENAPSMSIEEMPPGDILMQANETMDIIKDGWNAYHIEVIEAIKRLRV